MSRSRQTGLLLALALLAACSTRAPLPAPPAPVRLVAPLPPVAMLQSPIDTHRFEIDSNDDVLGTLQRVIASREDTLPDIARRFNVGYEEIVRVNPGVDPWLPGEGREIIVPTRFVHQHRRYAIVLLCASGRRPQASGLHPPHRYR